MQRHADPLRQIADLWRNVGAGGKAGVIVAGIALLALLITWYAGQPSPRGTTPTHPPSAENAADAPDERPARKWPVPIATPMARERDRATAELETTLSEMEGIDRARVALNPADPTLFTEEEKPATAAICLWLKPDLTPTHAMVEGIATYVSRAVPALPLENITIVDGGGRTLFADGQVVDTGVRDIAAAVARSKAPAPDLWNRPPVSAEALQGVLLLSLAALAVVLTAILTRLRRPRREAAPAPEGPEGALEPGTPESPPSLSDFDTDAVIVALSRERLQVVAFALSGMQPQDAVAVLQGSPEGLQRDVMELLPNLGEVAPTIAAAAEEALLESTRRAAVLGTQGSSSSDASPAAAANGGA